MVLFTSCFGLSYCALVYAWLKQYIEKMGMAISRMVKMLFARKEMRILMVGLDAAGKTTILYKLKLGEVVTTIPTIGTIYYSSINPFFFFFNLFLFSFMFRVDYSVGTWDSLIHVIQFLNFILGE